MTILPGDNTNGDDDDIDDVNNWWYENGPTLGHATLALWHNSMSLKTKLIHSRSEEMESSDYK